MNVLITGGSGFFGKSMLSWLKHQQLGIKKLLILSRNPYNLDAFFSLKDFDFELEYISHNILEPIKYDDHIDYIIHAVSESSKQLALTSPLDLYELIVKGTKNILNFAVSKKTKQLLFISSGSVYGELDYSSSGVTELSPCCVNSLNSFQAYSVAKVQAENLCSIFKFQYGLTFSAARCFAFVGPFLPRDAHFAIGNFINQAINREDIIIRGDGTAVRSYLYADDLAEWLWTILMNGLNGSVYNIGSDYPVSILDLAKRVQSLIGSGSEIIVMNETKDEKRNFYVPNVDKIKTELGVKQQISLDVAIQLSSKKLIND